MADRKGVVEVLIRAKDSTARVVGQFRRRWRAMERTVKDVSRAVVAFTAAGAAAVLTLTKLGQRGDEVNAVKRAFAQITGDEVAALNRLREASAGTINDFKLMALANQAMTLGAAKSVDEFAEMVEISRILGRAQGVDALSSLESLTIGIARQSKMLLDNLGIMVDVEQGTNFAAAAMEQARKKAAEFSGSMQDSTSWADRFTTAIANQKDRLSELVAESPRIAAFFDGFTDIVSTIVDAIEGQDWEQLTELFKTIGRMAGDAMSIGVNEGIEAFIDKGNPFGRWVASIFGGNADIGRGNLAANRTALDSIIRSMRADAAARQHAARFRSQGQTAAGPAPFIPFLGAGVPSSLTQFNHLPWAPPDRSAEHRAARRLHPFLSPTAGTPTAWMRGDPGELRRELDDTSESFENAGRVAVASMSSAAAAIISGSENIEASLISMITNVVRELPGVGGILGTVIGGVGAIAGALFSRGGRDRAVPVRLAEVDDAAADKLANAGDGPLRITTIIEQGGVEISRIERELVNRQNRDKVVRFSRGRALASRG